MSENVVPLNGVKSSPVVKEPHQGVIEFLERLLQDARSGDVVGVACAYQNPDWRSGYAIVGFVGGFSMAGAAYNILQEVGDINRGLAVDEDDE
jgi:hypothetical protein